MNAKYWLPSLILTFFWGVSLHAGAQQPMPPVMGWASWNNYRIHISDDIIRAQTDALVASGLADAGYRFINIDDGFFGGRDQNGSLLVHPTRFPGGMKSLASYIHLKGLKAGIYSDAGINTCASYWDKDTIGVGMGLYGHDDKDLALFLKDWGYDYIKVDWCGGEWLGLDEEQRYTQIIDKAKSIRPDVVFNVCRWKFPGTWVTNQAHSWRISGDIANSFESVMHIVDMNADLWPYASLGHYNDMDMLQVGRGMSLEEDKTHFTMWCIMQSPLVLGNDLTQMSEQTLSVITNADLITVNQSEFVYQARRLVDQGDLEVWARPLVSVNSGQVVAVLLNRSGQEQSMTLNLVDVGIDASRGYAMKDLWSKEEFPQSSNDSLTFVVPAHGVIALKINGAAIPFNAFQYKDQK